MDAIIAALGPVLFPVLTALVITLLSPLVAGKFSDKATRAALSARQQRAYEDLVADRLTNPGALIDELWANGNGGFHLLMGECTISAMAKGVVEVTEIDTGRRMNFTGEEFKRDLHPIFAPMEQ